MRIDTFCLNLLFVLGEGIIVLSCDTVNSPQTLPPTASAALTQAEVRTLVVQAVQQAQRLNKPVTIFVVSREGDTLAGFRMTGSPDSSFSALRKARTAAYLSSNGHAFTSLTACFITRDHFPPGISNTPGGPLYGVGFSSLPGGDVQPNPGPLDDEPGGVPVYKNGVLVGGMGVSGAGRDGFDKELCAGVANDETIALGAIVGFAVPDDRRGDNIFIDGIRFLYANASTPAGNFIQPFNEFAAGNYIKTPVLGSASQYPPDGGYVTGVGPGFPSAGGSILGSGEVKSIIDRAAAQAARTRAAIRRPLGAAAQVFISVVDTNGAILGIWRTPDATIFSFDVAAQKARTALAFSDPANGAFGNRIRTIMGLPAAQPLAMTTRAIGFLSQRFFPPGIDESTLDNPVEQGPLYEGPDFAYQKRLFADPQLPAYHNGITIFPGGIPLYKNGQLAGAIGISGDGVDQDDYIAAAGTVGYEPPPEIRCDQIMYRTVRLPYVKFPRNPDR